mmetsp:Transcript_19280/g.52969  ORF Transcript_19280/g.52969 Transcript_19280/m.52969 type:complete len:370 (+) Transcript_19280:712-1821(+)
MLDLDLQRQQPCEALLQGEEPLPIRLGSRRRGADLVLRLLPEVRLHVLDLGLKCWQPRQALLASAEPLPLRFCGGRQATDMVKAFLERVELREPLQHHVHKVGLAGTLIREATIQVAAALSNGFSATLQPRKALLRLALDNAEPIVKAPLQSPVRKTQALLEVFHERALLQPALEAMRIGLQLFEAIADLLEDSIVPLTFSNCDLLKPRVDPTARVLNRSICFCPQRLAHEIQLVFPSPQPLVAHSQEVRLQLLEAGAHGLVKVSMDPFHGSFGCLLACLQLLLALRHERLEPAFLAETPCLCKAALLAQALLEVAHRRGKLQDLRLKLQVAAASVARSYRTTAAAPAQRGATGCWWTAPRCPLRLLVL